VETVLCDSCRDIATDVALISTPAIGRGFSMRQLVAVDLFKEVCSRMQLALAMRATSLTGRLLLSSPAMPCSAQIHAQRYFAAVLF